MAEEADNLALVILREMRVDVKLEFTRLDETLHDVRRHVASAGLRVGALDKKFEVIRDGDLQKQLAALTRRVETLEAAK